MITTMETEATDALRTVENNTNSLISSILKYSPSTDAVVSVITAEESLIQTLYTLKEHQENHARLLHLRILADALDAQIKDTIRTLAQVRTDIIAIPWTAVEPKGREVPVNDLLRFAKNISKYTVPHTFPDEHEGDGPEEAPAEQTDAAATAEAPVVVDGPSEPTKDPESDFAWSSLTPEERIALQGLQRNPFVPWPNPDAILASGLSMITQRINEGVLPARLGLDTAVAQQPAPEELKLQVDEEDRVPNSAIEDLAPLSAIPRERAPQVGGVERPKKAAFQGFGLDDDDADD
jgi:hypothetical protein